MVNEEIGKWVIYIVWFHLCFVLMGKCWNLKIFFRCICFFGFNVILPLWGHSRYSSTPLRAFFDTYYTMPCMIYTSTLDLPSSIGLHVTWSCPWDTRPILDVPNFIFPIPWQVIQCRASASLEFKIKAFTQNTLTACPIAYHLDCLSRWHSWQTTVTISRL